MSATVASLLKVMTIRLSMCDSGVITPQRQVIDATRTLVAELNALEPFEAIEVTYSKNPTRVQYLRQKTGRILAEFTVDAENLTS